MTLPESLSKKGKPLSAYKAVKSLLIILLVTKQSKIDFNAVGSWIIINSFNVESYIDPVRLRYSSDRIEKGSSEITFSHIS